MSTLSQITVSDVAIRQAKALGFRTDTEARVRGIAAHAAPIPHPQGNAAYGPFILLIRGNRVEAFSVTGPQVVDDRPVSACLICKGLMTIPVRSVMDGKEGIAHRPCPRAFDHQQPICDTVRRTTK